MFDTSELESQTPLSQRAWWNTIQTLDSLSERTRLYELSLSYIPGSYKLWYNYLLEIRLYVSNNQSLDHYDSANLLHERCLTYMHQMPQLWLDYTEFLHSQGHITKTRQVFDLSLQRLPLTQHDLIWDAYISFVQTIRCPLTTKSVFKRYLQMSPSFITDYIEFLIQNQFISDAVTEIRELLKVEDSSDLWKKLIELLAEHPDCIEDSEEVIKECQIRIEEKGRAWELVAEFYLRRGEIDEARRTYETALANVESVKEFSLIFAAYSQLEEQLCELFEGNEEEQLKALERMKDLMWRREELLSDVRLRIDPNDVEEWIARVELKPESIEHQLRTYAKAVTIVDPLKSKGSPQKLWINFARLYEAHGDFKSARIVFHKGTMSRLKKSDQIAEIWEEWVLMELRHRHYNDALVLIRKVCNFQHKYSKETSIFQEVSTNNRLWTLYIDLEESLGSQESTRSAYEKMITYRFATVHTILNFSTYLQQHNLWEESFRIYEQGINKFIWPHVYDIWICYLNRFVEYYGCKKLERARDLFEQVLTVCPKEKIRVFYLLYAKLEEEFGLGNHLIEIFEKAVRDVPYKEKAELFIVYMQKVSEYYGVIKMRSLFENCFEIFTDPDQVIDIGIQFANIEKKLGEIDRARGIFLHISQFCDAKRKDHQRFWTKWNEFEIYHGNEDTYKEMMRVQRTSMFNAAGVNLTEVDRLGEEEGDPGDIEA